MTEVTLTPVALDSTGAALGAVAATAEGFCFVNDGKTIAQVTNGSGSPITITPDAYPSGNTTTPPDGLTVTDRVITVAAGVTKLIGPFPKSIYNDALGKVHFAISLPTTVTLGAFRVSKRND